MIFLLGLFLSLAGPALGASGKIAVPEPGSYAGKQPRWIAEAKADAEKEVQEWERAKAIAESAIAQAEEALKSAHRENNAEAMSKAQEALDLAKRARQAAESLIEAANTRLDRLNEHLSRTLPADEKYALPTLARGQVETKSSAGWRALDFNKPLKEGDGIRTGQDSRVEVILRNGTRLQLGPNTYFVYKEPTPDHFLIEFVKGLLHLYTPPPPPPSVPVQGRRIQVQGMTAIAAVRGTEFEFNQDSAGFCHLKPIAGKIELEARPGGERGKLERWWEEGRETTPASPLPLDKLLRVDFVRGEVILESGGDKRPARVGDLLAAKDVLSTGKDGLAQLAFAKSGTIALGTGSRLETLAQGDNKRPVFALWRGLLHLGAEESPLLLMTPNAVAALRGAEFSLSVDENGLADYLPLAGSLEITAKREKLGLDRLQLWWREPW